LLALAFEFAIDIKQAQPMASFLDFSSANLDLHHKILLSDRFPIASFASM
jgi:hypothetical protein